MKIYKDLFQRMTEIDSIFKAWDEFKKGKRNKLDVQIFEYDLENNLFQLQQDLIIKAYKPGAYSKFYVRDPKPRIIHKTEVRDRIIHHLLFKTLSPIFEPTFICDSYSCIKNRGTHKAIKRLEIFARKTFQTHGQCFILKCDVRKFFPTINHKILLNIISRTIKDPDVLWLIKLIVKGFATQSQNVSSPIGVPIGNLTSQLFANIYLNELDQYLKQTLKIKYYLRYTDDFIIVHYNKNYLLYLKSLISKFLEKCLHLSLHPEKVYIRKYKQGFDFLGYIVLPKARILRTKTKNRIFRKLKGKFKLFILGKISEKSLLQSINSYLGVFSHADSYKLQKKLLKDFSSWVAFASMMKTKDFSNKISNKKH